MFKALTYIEKRFELSLVGVIVILCNVVFYDGILAYDIGGCEASAGTIAAAGPDQSKFAVTISPAATRHVARLVK